MSDELDDVMTPKRFEEAAAASLKARRESRRPILYQRGEWMVLERGDGTIEQIAKVGVFKAEQLLVRL